LEPAIDQSKNLSKKRTRLMSGRTRP
jgi:hypothetical protein